MRALVRRLVALCSAAVVLVGALAAGKSYLWCSMMQASVETCCCSPEPSVLDEGASERPELRSACCEHRAHDDLATVRLPTIALDVPPGLRTGFVVADASTTMAGRVSALAPAAPSRAGGATIRAGPSTATETCVRLQVFRC